MFKKIIAAVCLLVGSCCAQVLSHTNGGTDISTGSTDGYVLTWDAGTGKWKAASVAGGLRSMVYVFGDAATGSTLTTSEVGYLTVPFACTITGWHIMADAGTATVKTWRVNGGTALPTSSNSISTSGVSLSTGTKIDSSTTSDFTSTAIVANDTLGFNLSAVATAKQITFQLDCQQ